MTQIFSGMDLLQAGLIAFIILLGTQLAWEIFNFLFLHEVRQHLKDKDEASLR
jgi:hypothetical protein